MSKKKVDGPIFSAAAGPECDEIVQPAQERTPEFGLGLALALEAAKADHDASGHCQRKLLELSGC